MGDFRLTLIVKRLVKFSFNCLAVPIIFSNFALAQSIDQDPPLSLGFRYTGEAHIGHSDSNVSNSTLTVESTQTLLNDNKDSLSANFWFARDEYSISNSHDLLRSKNRPLLLNNPTDPLIKDATESSLVLDFIHSGFGWTWSAGGGPSVGFEDGAKISDSLTVEAFSTISYKFSENLSVGFGISIANQLEADRLIIPFPVLTWTLPGSGRWKLSLGDSALDAALTYQANDALSLSLSAIYEYHQFRLEQKSGNPPSAFWNDSARISISSNYKVTKHLKTVLEVGLVLPQEYSVRTAGEGIAQWSTDPTYFVGFTFIPVYR